MRPTTIAALLGAPLSISFSSVLVRRSYALGAHPSGAILVRLAVPATLFLVIAVVRALQRSARDSPAAKAIGAQPWLRMCALGCLSSLAAAGEITALHHMAAALVILFFALAPIWIGIALRVVWRVPLGARGAAAALAAVVGTAIIVGPAHTRGDVTGILLAIGGSLAGSGAFLLLDRGLRGPPIELVWATALSTATLLTVCVAPSAFAHAVHGGGSTLVLALAGLLAGLAQVLATVAIRRTDAFVAGIAATLEPVHTSWIAWILLSETLAPNEFAGGVVVLCGVALAIRRHVSASRPASVEG